MKEYMKPDVFIERKVIAMKKKSFLKKQLCTFGLIAASVTAGIAVPAACNMSLTQDVYAETTTQATASKTEKVAVTGVKLNAGKLTLTVGQTTQLKATVSPANATNKAVTWTSSNTKIATVDKNGKVKGIKAGKAKITAKTKDGGKTASCIVTVKEKNGWFKEGGGWKYYKNGKAYKGWHYMTKAEGEKTPHWSYFGKDGKIYTGWRTMGKAEGEKTTHVSYFGNNGWLVTGWQWMDASKGESVPHWSYFGSNGWLRTGWQWMDKKEGEKTPHWSYFGSNGWLKTGLVTLGADDGEKEEHRSYFGNNGWLVTNKTFKVKVDGETVTFNADANGWAIPNVVGIKNNGAYGIKIDIKKDPYKQYSHYSYAGAYGRMGCAWFASARAKQRTGKGTTITGGPRWWNEYKSWNLTRGSVPKADSLICFQSDGVRPDHVGYVEKVIGDEMIISEGGISYYSDDIHGYCAIRKVNIKQYERSFSKFLGYVYLK